MLLCCPGSQGTHWMCDPSGCVPDGHAVHDTPSSPTSFSPQASQNAEKSLNVHLLPALHGLSTHLSMSDAMVETALLASSAGVSIVVLVMRREGAAVTDSEAPFGATFARKALSLMVTMSGPDVAMAPPFLALTPNS